jgi:hypothetical protein
MDIERTHPPGYRDLQELSLNASLRATAVGDIQRSARVGTLVEFDDSALAKLTPSEIASLARMAAKHQHIFRFLPEGSRLAFFAKTSIDRGDDRYYTAIYCALRVPGSQGSFRDSGKEVIYLSSCGPSDVTEGFKAVLTKMGGATETI